MSVAVYLSAGAFPTITSRVRLSSIQTKQHTASLGAFSCPDLLTIATATTGAVTTIEPIAAAEIRGIEMGAVSPIKICAIAFPDPEVGVTRSSGAGLAVST